MVPTPHTKIRGDVAGQVSPPSEKIVPTPLIISAVSIRQCLRHQRSAQIYVFVLQHL